MRRGTALGGVAAFEKGLAGALPRVIDAARDTATNPAFQEHCAFHHLRGRAAAYPGISATNRMLPEQRRPRCPAGQPAELRTASYVSEVSSKQWQRTLGEQLPKTAQGQTQSDPEGLFVVHHGVGSKAWSDDGFRLVREARVSRGCRPSALNFVTE